MHRWMLSIALLLVLVPLTRADEEASPLTDEDRKDLAFFAKLGPPGVKDRPFVEVKTGEGYREDDGEIHEPTVRGFLLEAREDGSFDVWTGEPFIKTYRLAEPHTPAERQVAYRELDLAEVVRKRLAGEDQRRFEGDLFEQLHARFAERMSGPGRVLALAWASAQRGLDAEAHALLAKARDAAQGPLRETAYEVLAEHVIWRLVEAFGHPEVSRRQLLRGFQRFLEAFPQSEEHAKTASEAARILARMVEEDARHDRAPRPISALKKDERIAEWIFRLRDQNGHQMMQPGGPSIFATASIENDSPAEQLVAIGYEAVPRLIEALDDARFTRTVGFWRDFTYSHYVVRIGGAAASILDAITGRHFEDQNAWRAWWREFSQDGITEGLAREVRAGGEGAIDAARTLVTRSAERAVPAILQGIENAQMEHTHGYLVGVLATVPGAAQLDFMRRELEEGPTLHDRLRAARWLYEQGHPEGFASIVRLWERLQAVEAPDPRAAIPVAIFFVILGTEEAARVLRAGVERLPASIRGEILGRLYVGRTRSEHWPPAEAAADAILQGVLVRALVDETPFPTADGFLRTPEGDDPRICEAAARRLAFVWRDEGVTYTQDAFRADRDRQIRAVINHWRQKEGVLPLPEPKAPGLPQLGNRVRETRLVPDDIDLGFATTRFLEDLAGEAIDAAAFAGLVDAAVQAEPTGTRGVEAVLWRPADGSGVVVTLTFLALEEGQEVDRDGWDMAIEVRAGRAVKIDESSGYGRLARIDEFLGTVDRALAKPLDLAVRAVVRVTRTER